METLSDQTCSVCLDSDRKIVTLSNELKKQCFLRIILEISASEDDSPVFLCWECDALLTRFTKFKQRAQKSYLNLHNFTNKYPVTSALRSYPQYNISLPANEEVLNSFHIEYIKNETNELAEVKEEYNYTEENNVSDNYSDDDNKTLIELSSKNKGSNFKKKRQKREKPANKSQIQLESEYYREKELTQKEIEEERASQRLKEDYVNAAFRCTKCILSFPNDDDLKDHIHLKHELNAASFKCEWCECTFGSLVAFNYHVRKHARRYACAACDARFTDKRGATKHYELTHTVRPLLDYENALTKNFKEDDPKQNGDERNPAADLFPCEFCDKKFKFKTSLRKHAEKHRIESGQKRRPYCDICRLTFSGTSNLQKHVKSSSKHQIQLKLRKLKEQSVDNPTDIEEIRSRVNSVRQMFPCGQCDRKFQWRGNLLRHLHSHRARANGELVCEPCNRTFSSIATYKQHMKLSRKHVSENDFKYMCSDCGKKFANRTRLKDHVDWEHLKNFVHKCTTCAKVFKSHTSLYLHKQVVHKKDSASHLCDHCGKPFPNRTKLRAHVAALHSPRAAYACPTCNARFGWHSCLSRHRRRVHRDNAQ